MLQKVNNKEGDTLYGVLSGKHICLFYYKMKDLIDLEVPYFKEGLKNNELCVWIVPKTLGVKRAKSILSKKIKDFNEYIKKGQIEIMDYKTVYLKSGEFNAKRVLTGWAKKERQALKQSFSGLRVSGDASWLKQKDWAELVNYEVKAEKLIPKLKMTALCTYPVSSVDVSDVVVLAANHRFAFCNKDNKWHIIKNVKLGNLLFNIRYFLEKK